ncbi:MAG: SprT family zinc-dependent metalloprotease [Candidatus Norongarragalinales archaeon]
MPEVIFGEQKIEFERLASKSKNTITIQVDSGKKVSVKAPTDLSEGELTRIVKTKTSWIIDKFQRIDEIKGFENTREFVSGESFLYKGKLLRLKVIPAPDAEEVYTDTTTIFCKTGNSKNPERIAQLLEEWYKQRAKQYLENRVLRFSNKFKKKPAKIRIRNQSLRWGSCTKKGEILLNWRIIMAPPSVIDYVIIHELAHLKEKNHTKEFWELVKNAMPNYEEKREWLRVNGTLLSLR